MLFVLYLSLSFFCLARSTATNLIRVNDGESLKLPCKCTSPTVSRKVTYFWIRSVGNKVPEVLAGTFPNCSPEKPNNTRFNATCDEKKETFILHLSRVEASDSGLYYCVEIDDITIKYLNSTFVGVNGPETDIQTDISFNVSGHLQCSVFSGPESPRCSGEPTVYWFISRNGQVSVLHTHKHRGDECVKESRTAQQKCVYNLVGSIASSDSETHYCAVVACGQVLFGNGSKLDTEVNPCPSVQFVLVGVLAVTLGVTAVMIFIIWKQKCQLKAFQTTPTGDQNLQGNNHLVYATPTFSKMREERRNTATNVVEDVIYSDAKVHKYHRNRKERTT